MRSAVSQDRTRFKDHDSNLDLTYITDTLIGARCFAYGDITRLRVSHASYAPFICFLGSQFVAAMGYPASGLESAWRNHIDEVCSCLATRTHKALGRKHARSLSRPEQHPHLQPLRPQVRPLSLPYQPMDALFIFLSDTIMRSSGTRSWSLASPITTRLR